MAGVAVTVPLAQRFGKKTTFVMVNALLAMLSVVFFSTLALLGAFGYITDPQLLAANAAQPQAALMCLRWLMSFIPAGVALLAIVVAYFYPLTTSRMKSINADLSVER